MTIHSAARTRQHVDFSCWIIFYSPEKKTMSSEASFRSAAGKVGSAFAEGGRATGEGVKRMSDGAGGFLAKRAMPIAVMVLGVLAVVVGARDVTRNCKSQSMDKRIVAACTVATGASTVTLMGVQWWRHGSAGNPKYIWLNIAAVVITGSLLITVSALNIEDKEEDDDAWKAISGVSIGIAVLVLVIIIIGHKGVIDNANALKSGGSWKEAQKVAPVEVEMNEMN